MVTLTSVKGCNTIHVSRLIRQSGRKLNVRFNRPSDRKPTVQNRPNEGRYDGAASPASALVLLIAQL